MKDDFFIIGAWLLIPFIVSAVVASSRFRSKILLAVVSAALFALIGYAIYYAQTHDGEQYVAASIFAFFLGIVFFGVQLGAGGVWIYQALKKKRRDRP